MPSPVVTCYSSLGENCDAVADSTMPFRGSGAEIISKMTAPPLDSRVEKSGQSSSEDYEFVLYGKASAPTTRPSSTPSSEGP